MLSMADLIALKLTPSFLKEKGRHVLVDLKNSLQQVGRVDRLLLVAHRDLAGSLEDLLALYREVIEVHFAIRCTCGPALKL